MGFIRRALFGFDVQSACAFTAGIDRTWRKALPQAFALGCLAVLLLTTTPTYAREWQSEHYHCAVELPDSWQERHEECNYPVALAAADSTGKRLLYAVVFRPDKTTPPLLPDLYAVIEEGALRGARGNKESGRNISWLNHPAYEFSYSVLGTGGEKTTALCRVVRIGDWVYSLKLVSTGNPADDPELSAIAASFRIIVAENGQNKTLEQYLIIAAIAALLVTILGYGLASRRKLVRLIADVKAIVRRWSEAGFSAKAAEEQIWLAGGPEAMVAKLMAYVQLEERLAPDKEAVVRLISCCGRQGASALLKLTLYRQCETVRSAAVAALGKMGEAVHCTGPGCRGPGEVKGCSGPGECGSNGAQNEGEK